MLSLTEKVRLFTDHIRSWYEAVNVPFPTNPDPFRSITTEDLAEIERALSVTLPNDLRNIASIAPIICGVQFVLTPQLPLDRFYKDENVIDKTIRLREVTDLPHRYVLLSEFDESFILMETQPRADLPTPVYWLGLEASGFITEEPITNYVEIFSSYEEWFVYCLNDEIDQILHPYSPPS